MRRNFRSDRFRAGLTGGWLLAVLAVIAIVVIILLFVWRPGGAPGTPGAGPTPQERTEGDARGPADVDDPAQEVAPGFEEQDGGDADDDPAVPADDGPAREAAEEPEEAPLDQPEDDADAEDAEDADAEDADADVDEADEADEPRSDDQEAADDAEEPVDATVETDEPLQTDLRNREAEVGDQLGDVTRRAMSALEDVERRLQGIHRATDDPPADVPDEMDESEPAAPEEGADPDAAQQEDGPRARIREATLADGGARERSRRTSDAVAASPRTRPEQREAAVELGDAATGDAEATEARTRSLDRNRLSAERISSTRDRIRGAVEDRSAAGRTDPGADDADVRLDDAAAPESRDETRVRTLEPATRAAGAAGPASDPARREAREEGEARVELVAADRQQTSGDAGTRTISVRSPDLQTVMRSYDVETRRVAERSTESTTEGDDPQ